MKIIWIDDDEWRCQPIIESLKLYSNTVAYFSDYEVGYNSIKDKLDAYDVIILDVMMPPGNMLNVKKNLNGGQTGLLLYDILRKESKKIPILIYTVLRNSPLLDKFLKSDTNASWLNKPASTEKIIELLKKLT